MIRLAAILAILGSPLLAQTDGHCMGLSYGPGCADGSVIDSKGVLLPGIHAYYGDPTTRYQHGVFGDVEEWGSLTYLVQGSADHGPYFYATVNLPADRVFEDLAPRLADMDGDGEPEIVVVETKETQGAQLAIYDLRGDELVKRWATEPIGRTHRWLAPAGIADFNGDGRLDIAYIETPHLGKTLRIWTIRRGRLIEIARASGLTNHAFGEDYITSAVRECDGVPYLLTVDRNWRNIIATWHDGQSLKFETLARFRGARDILDAPEGCPN